MKIKDIIVESSNMASAEQIWDYVGGIHPKDQQGGGFLKSLVMLNPEYELKRVPLSSLHIPNDEDEGNDPYGRAMFVDVYHAEEYSQYEVDKKPLVVDSQGYILDGAHRAWAAAELLNKKDIMAYVPVKTRTSTPQDLEIRKKFTNQNVTEDSKNFNQCYEKACQVFDRAEDKKLDPVLLQVAGYNGDGSNADSKWLKMPQRVWQHYVVVVGNTVYDPTATQFGDDKLTKYSVKQLQQDWDQQYQIRPKQGVAEGKIKLYTDPGYFGAEVDDAGFDSLPVINISADRLAGFEPDSKMQQPKSRANVKKIVAGLKKGDKLPPLLVRKYKNGYQVLDGHHRFWAYKLSGTKSIPVQIVADKDIEEISKPGVAEGESNTMANTASRLANKDDGKVAKLRVAGDKRREEQLKGRDIAKRDRTSKDEWDDLLPVVAEGVYRGDWVRHPDNPWQIGQIQSIDNGQAAVIWKKTDKRKKAMSSTHAVDALQHARREFSQLTQPTHTPGMAEDKSNDTAISLSKLGKFHPGADTLAQFVPERATAQYALHPDKWESTFYSLTNKDSDKLKYYGPKKISIPPGTLVGDMAIANKFYRAKTTVEKQQYAEAYKASLQPYPVDVSEYRMPELLIPKQGVADDESLDEGLLGNMLPWPEVVNKINSAMRAMGWKGQRKDDGSFIFTTRGAMTDEYYIVIIDNEGDSMFTYALGTVEEGDPHIGEQDTLPTTEASVSELMNAVRDGFGLNENFADGKNPGRKGLAKRSGVNTKASVSSLRKTAKNSSGEKQRMAHWLANMKAGRAKARKK